MMECTELTIKMCEFEEYITGEVVKNNGKLTYGDITVMNDLKDSLEKLIGFCKSAREFQKLKERWLSMEESD